MTTSDYDLFVIGAGSGGVRAARIAATHGAKVGVAEEYRVGGTCVIRGCVPKKLLVYASRYRDEFEDAAGFGWSVGEPSFDWANLIANKDTEIARLEAAYRRNLERAGVALIESRAVIEGPGRIRLTAMDKVVTAKTILIATGARPYRDASIPGIEHAITSDEAFHLTALPKSIVIVGGGYIAVEFAGIFNGLGSQVTHVHRGEKILRGFDDDLRVDLAADMTRRGIKQHLPATLAKVETVGDGFRAMLSTGDAVACDAVMVATGRVPNTAGLGLEAAGVELGLNGRIMVDGKSQTTVPGIYAVGDVTDRVNLTPVAIREGHAFADSLYGGKPWSTDYDFIPTGVFSTPEIGTVGLSEDAARAAYAQVDIYKTRFRPMKAVLAGRDERMLMKLVVDAASDRVVGCHVLGPDAAEMAQMAAIAMRMKATKADFDATMPLHPSAAEELVTLREKWVA
ncbi:MAG: glutathione-disulfide reductase [Hyphomicrobiaceae bacterium]